MNVTLAIAPCGRRLDLRELQGLSGWSAFLRNRAVGEAEASRRVVTLQAFSLDAGMALAKLGDCFRDAGAISACVRK
jgi:hypothetical protein